MYAGKSQPVPIPSVGDHGKLLIQKNGGSSIGFVGKQGTGRQRYSPSAPIPLGHLTFVALRCFSRKTCSASPRKLPQAASNAFFYLAAASVKGTLRRYAPLTVRLSATVERRSDAGSEEASR